MPYNEIYRLSQVLKEYFRNKSFDKFEIDFAKPKNSERQIFLDISVEKKFFKKFVSKTLFGRTAEHAINLSVFVLVIANTIFWFAHLHLAFA